MKQVSLDPLYRHHSSRTVWNQPLLDQEKLKLFRNKPIFCGKDEQKHYETWLRSFPIDVLKVLEPITDMARVESTQNGGKIDERDIATLMQRPHIKEAVCLGKQHPLVGEFNRLVIELNKRRLAAKRSGEDSQIQQAQEPLTDLGKALKRVLSEIKERLSFQ